MLQSSRINRHLSTLQGVQFASEYLIGMRGPPKESFYTSINKELSIWC